MDAINDRFSMLSGVVTSLEEVREVIGHPKAQIAAKVIDHLSGICRDFIARSPFMLVASSNRLGQCEVSPKGDPAGFVRVLDDKHLLIPDRPGNKLAVTLTNLCENPHLGLIFLIPGKKETLRVNGEARITRDLALRESLAVKGKIPDLAIVLYVETAEVHCPKCIVRSNLWEADTWRDTSDMPTIGEATKIHGKLEMSLEELRTMAEKDGLTRLY
jgi:PPOX class probable FMN-dependent enzyme